MHAWLCSILLVSLLTGAGAAAQESGDRTKGLAVARDVCARCHAVEADEGSSVSGAPTFRTIANAPDMSEIALSVLLRTPHKTMPNLTFEPDELRDVVAYIMSLRDRP